MTLLAKCILKLYLILTQVTLKQGEKAQLKSNAPKELQQNTDVKYI